jgi:hypothetical protein
LGSEWKPITTHDECGDKSEIVSGCHHPEFPVNQRANCEISRQKCRFGDCCTRERNERYPKCQPKAESRAFCLQVKPKKAAKDRTLSAAEEVFERTAHS